MVTLAALAAGPSRFPGSVAGGEQLVSAGFTMSGSTDYILDLAPTLVTQRYAADAASRAVQGDVMFGGGTLTDYWQRDAVIRRGILQGVTDLRGAAAAREAAIVSPLWGPAERMRRMPPLIFEVGWGGCWVGVGRLGCVPATVVLLICMQHPIDLQGWGVGWAHERAHGSSRLCPHLHTCPYKAPCPPLAGGRCGDHSG